MVISSMVWCGGVVVRGVVVIVDFVLGGREVVISLFGMLRGVRCGLVGGYVGSVRDGC